MLVVARNPSLGMLAHFHTWIWSPGVRSPSARACGPSNSLRPSHGAQSALAPFSSLHACRPVGLPVKECFDRDALWQSLFGGVVKGGLPMRFGSMKIALSSQRLADPDA
jgi:hypothetical protein